MNKSLPVELLEKYISGRCSDDEILLVKQWYKSFGHDYDHASALDVHEESELKERIYQNILDKIEAADHKEQKVRSLSKWYKISAAAAVIIACTATFITLKQKHAADKQQALVNSDMVVITNNTNQIYKSVLPDHSAVWIKPHSKLSFPKIFSTSARMVSMAGECFFEVTKNPQKPFVISSRSIITKVWGTSFLIRDRDDKSSADVSVLTGKVSVSIKDKVTGNLTDLKINKDEVMIYPHQKVVYLAAQHTLKPLAKSNEPALQIWNRVNLSFDNKPLSAIIPVLNSKFHVHITVSNAKFNQYVLTADLSGFNLPEVLEALKKSLNVNYEMKQNEIQLV